MDTLIRNLVEDTFGYKSEHNAIKSMAKITAVALIGDLSMEEREAKFLKGKTDQDLFSLDYLQEIRDECIDITNYIAIGIGIDNVSSMSNFKRFYEIQKLTKKWAKTT